MPGKLWVLMAACVVCSTVAGGKARSENGGPVLRQNASPSEIEAGLRRGLIPGQQQSRAPASHASPASSGVSLRPSPVVQPVSTTPTGVSLLILFDYDSAELSGGARAFLDKLGNQLKTDEFQSQRYVLEGHTDARGSEDYNQVLSERRAKAVRDYLISASGINEQRLQAVGKGETDLFDTAKPEAKENRRVRLLPTDG
jgi:outer membrane protein OmpA-like peptidoglycan-associated protein